jgi:hypothetical protein
MFSGTALQDLGYAPIVWKGEHTYAKPNEWIVRMNDVTGSADKQIQAINGRIGKGRHGLHASRMLGKDGLTLVQTTENLSIDQVEASLADSSGFVSVEPNFALTASALPNDSYFSLEYGLNNTGRASAVPSEQITPTSTRPRLGRSRMETRAPSLASSIRVSITHTRTSRTRSGRTHAK